MSSETTRAAGLRHPPWIRIRYAGGGTQAAVNELLRAQDLNTVCQGAHCPNQHECFSRGVATFMILGRCCTRDCRFCAVDSGRPQAVDADEPRRVAEASRSLGLRHVVVTSVTRDDLPDGGASQFAAVIRCLRELLPEGSVEVLTPDFKGEARDISLVLEAGPDVFNHNLETVRRLQVEIRPAASYACSLAVLAYAARWRERHAASRDALVGRRPLLIKSGLMVGLGETDDEVVEAMHDLRQAGVELLTIGQYLAPSSQHAPVVRYVTPARFEEFAEVGRKMGFSHVAAGPMVRSSYMAEHQFYGCEGGGRSP